MKRLITFLSTMLLLLMLVPKTAGATDFYVKKYDGWTPYLHIYGGGCTNTVWSGIKGETLVKEAGTNNYWYKITYDTGSASKVTLIVNKGSSQDQSDNNGYTVDVKAALCVDWNGNKNGQISNVTDATGKTFTAYDPREEYYIHYGNGTSPWEDVYFNAEGKAELTLEGNKTYNFGIKKNGSDTWYTNGGTMTSTNCTNWPFNSGGGNAGITTTNAGRYIFSITLNGDVPSLSVTYPSGGSIDIPVSGIAPNAYYLVSPELTNGELRPNFKMIAERNRTQNNGNGEISKQYFSINFKDDEIRTMTNASSIHWYISKGDKTVQYRPHHGGTTNNYQLGIASPSYKGNNNNVKYQEYGGAKTENTSTKIFELPLGAKESPTGVSYTIILDTESSVSMNINQKSFVKDSDGYYLIGNFSKAVPDTGIDPSQESMRKKMTLYRYKDGFRYEENDNSVTDVTADSLVYMVHVDKPAEGWGNLYMNVASSSVIKSYTSSWINNSTAWNEVIRPQVKLLGAPGVDARAQKGGLIEKENNGLMSLNPEVDGDLYDSYDFSMNITTCTYRLVFNTNLYIVGDAVSTLDGKTGKSFNLEQKIPLTYDWEEGCYKYKGDGSMLHFDNGKQFRFVVNGKNYKTNYSENGNEPYSLKNGSYDAAIAGDETQYRNVVSYHNDGSESSEDPKASAPGNNNVTFALASGDYVLRFYIPQDNEPYYTITHEASLVIAPEETVCSWGGKVNPTGRVILTDNETTGTRVFIFTVDGSKPELVYGALPTNTQSATGTHLVRYEGNKLGDKGNIPAISSTFDKKIMFGGQEISPAISKSGNVILKAYAVITDPDNEVKYKISGDMQTAVYKFRDGVIIEIVPFAGKFLRTYSYSRPLDLPKDESVKAYEAYRFEKGEENSKSHGHVYLRRIKYIPANEGVVLVGEGTGEKTFVRTLNVLAEDELVTEKKDLWWNDYSSNSEWSEWNNYLVPTVEAVSDLGNVKVENEKITARYFGLGSFYETNEYQQNKDTNECGNYIGFFRLTPNGRSGANRAYLSIPATENKYGYIDFSGQWLDDNYEDPAASEPTLAKTALIFDDIDFGDVTGINNVITNENGINDNAYYTLQGVRVAKPVQGLYIHNGKKVIIK